jgi:CRP/FNR family transcriptional regulator
MRAAVEAPNWLDGNLPLGDWLMSLHEHDVSHVLDGAAVLATLAHNSGGDAPAKLPASCSICSLRGACLPCDLLIQGPGAAKENPIQHRNLKRGERLYRAGDEFHYLYTVRSGCLKTVQCLEGGRDQVTGFYMTGDLLGIDGISAQVHGGDAIALEDTRVCLIPYGRIEQQVSAGSRVLRSLHKAMSAEIVRQHGVMLLLGTMSAEERVAAFLLNLSERFLARGYSPSQFLLRMTRRDIGSFLGLKLETVSRVFSRFRDIGLVGVKRRDIFLRDLAGLRRCLGAECEHPAQASPAAPAGAPALGQHRSGNARWFALA